MNPALTFALLAIACLTITALCAFGLWIEPADRRPIGWTPDPTCRRGCCASPR